MNRIQNALVSVSDKTGVVPFAQALTEAGIEIFSTGGTRRQLEEAGFAVRDISAYTGFPELMDGRLKTLHPKVFGGILARRDHDLDIESLAAHEIRQFDLVVVNLYPFEATVAKPGTTMAEAIEKIDIGGPSLVRAAAKNHAFVTIVTSPHQYDRVAEEIQSTGGTQPETRQALAAEAFRHTADYDAAIAGYFQKVTTEEGSEGDQLPKRIWQQYGQVAALRYGENPHQRAALYRAECDGSATVAGSIVAAQQLHGKALSYNNYLDLDAALAIVRGFAAPAVSVIKHNNPCGVATDAKLEIALQKALDGDPQSAFGSILGVNRELTEGCAGVLSTPGLFVEAIIASSFTAPAIEILTTRPKWKNNVRLMAVGPLGTVDPSISVRAIAGGALVQDVDDLGSAYGEWQIVTSAEPNDAQIAELRFAWEVVRHVRSNAIVIGRDQAAVGVGAGQMSRVDAVEIALRKAGDRARGAVLASDAFFPFPDSIETAAAAGISAVVQPGGSRKDDDVVAACDRLGIAMVFTGRRHFRH